MGICNCMKEHEKNEINLEVNRTKEILSIFKDNPHMLLVLKKIQARFRGLIVRQRVKASRHLKNCNNSFFQKYENKREIVSLFLIHHII